MKPAVRLLLAVVAALSACHENSVSNVITPRLMIGPSPATIEKGAIIPLAASVYPVQSTPPVVVWQSSNARAVSVTDAGLLTALDTGDAVVRAVVPGTALRDSFTVKVVFLLPINETTTLVRAVRVHGTSTNVNPQAVSGVVDVVLVWNMPAGAGARESRITWNGNTVCSGPASDFQGEYICALDTRALPNGTGTLKGQLLNANGSVIASATFQILTIAN